MFWVPPSPRMWIIFLPVGLVLSGVSPCLAFPARIHAIIPFSPQPGTWSWIHRVFADYQNNFDLRKLDTLALQPDIVWWQ